MSRSVTFSPKAAGGVSNEEENIEASVEAAIDEATAPESAECLTCTQSVVYSPTFQVPAFYFTMHHSSRFIIILSPYASNTSYRRRTANPD